MDRTQLTRLVHETGEEITDDQGHVVGYVAQPLRLRLNQPHLARGGFLIITRAEESGEYIGAVFDALPHPKTGQPYPAGHSEPIFRVRSIAEAVERVLADYPEAVVS